MFDRADYQSPINFSARSAYQARATERQSKVEAYVSARKQKLEMNLIEPPYSARIPKVENQQ
jgi:hypothetical protein